MRICDIGEPNYTLEDITKAAADRLEAYEAEKKWESQQIMDVFLTAVMKKYNLPEIRLSVAELMEADTHWIERNRGAMTNGLLITFKGELNNNES